VALAPILGEVAARLGGGDRARDVSVVLEAPADIRVDVAPAAVSLVISNVLDNAIKFSPAGGKVTIEAFVEADAAVVAVSDTGPGVPEEERPRLFERFYRGSAARATDVPGVGLGLAICRLVVESQGGSIALLSVPGGGASIRIRLPLAT
jgi:two-component system OmpR family sensor kinase